MTTIYDNFGRADGALGGFWGPVIPNAAESMANALTGGILIRNKAYGPVSTGGGDACSIYGGGLSFGNDQWAQATLKTVAPPTALLNISAATFAAGSVTYNYTVTSGSMADAITAASCPFNVSGMQDAGNNVHMYAQSGSNVTATTLKGVNASGVTRAGQNGVGWCPSDSVAGVAIRCSGNSAATLSGYFFHAGSNSFSSGVTDPRIACYELWRIVNGVGQSLAFVAQNGITLPSPGDIIAIKAIGTTISGWVNGFQMFSVTDANIASGVPGLWSWSMSGPQQYQWANWTTTVNPPGNNGTSATSFVASDTGSPTFTTPTLVTASVTDSMTYANGDLHAANANWVYQTGTFQIATNKCYSSAAGIDNTYRSDFTPAADQYSTVTAVVTGLVGAQNCGPAVKMSTSAQTFYSVQYASATMRIIREIAGTLTTILTADASAPVTGDIVTLIIRGNTLWLTKNGVLVGSVVDYNSSITVPTASVGRVGLFGAASATVNGFSAFSGGNLVAPNFPSVFTGTGGLLLRGVG